jgi:hypothetical protein
MKRVRYLVWLPVTAGLVTFGLWFWARTMYLPALVCPPGGTCSPIGWEIGWSDYASVPLQLAGALNAPVATFAYPLYYLVQNESMPWNVLLFLGAAVLQWAYVGYVLDRGCAFLTRSPVIRVPIGALGILLGLFVLVFSIPLHHVSVLYRLAAFVWAVLICKHFFRFFRPRTVQSASKC